MTFELKEGRYHIAFWLMDFDKGNVLIGVFRDSKSEPWTALMRIRTYVDNKVFGSDDPKKWFHTTFPADMSEDAVEAHIDKSLPVVSGLMPSKGEKQAKSIQKIDVHSDDPSVAAERFRAIPAMHPAKATEEGRPDLDSWDTEEEVWDSFLD